MTEKPERIGGGLNPVEITQVYTYLCEERWLTWIARKMKTSITTISNYAKKFEREGKIKRILKSPATYIRADKAPSLNPPSPGSPLFKSQPLAIPHRCGAQFGVVEGKLRLGFKNGLWTDKKEAYTIQASHYEKVSIWLKAASMRGNTHDEIMNNAARTAAGLAKRFSEENSVKLAFIRWYDGIEWVFPDEKLSLTMAEALGFVSEPKVIANTKMVYDDSSDPGKAQWNATQEFPKAASENEKTFEYLLWHAPNLLKQLTEGVVAVNMKVEQLAKEVKKDYRK